MPFKIGGGHQMEEYDPSTGRYGCGSDYSKSFYKAQSFCSRYSNDANMSKTSKQMINYKKAITDDKKFTEYSLNENHPTGKDKAKLYKSILGYTKENYHSLKKQIHDKITSGTAPMTKVEKTQYGIIYTFKIKVSGPNGKSAVVLAAYQIDNNSAKPRMITNYVLKEAK